MLMKALLAHIECSVLIRAPGADQVDVDDLFHLCVGQLPSIAKVDDASVGNDHIQTTKGLPCLCKKILHILVRADIALDSQCLCTGGFDLCHGRLEGFAFGILHICQNNIKTVLCILQGVCLALTHCAARDQNYFSFHLYFLQFPFLFVIFQTNCRCS